MHDLQTSVKDFLLKVHEDLQGKSVRKVRNINRKNGNMLASLNQAKSPEKLCPVSIRHAEAESAVKLRGQE